MAFFTTLSALDMLYEAVIYGTTLFAVYCITFCYNILSCIWHIGYSETLLLKKKKEKKTIGMETKFHMSESSDVQMCVLKQL